MTVDALAAHLSLDSFLSVLNAACGSYEVLDHWQQGDFHHDLVLRVPPDGDPLRGRFSPSPRIAMEA